MVLQLMEAASQQQLSRLVGVDPRNVVAVLDVLERERLIRRRAHPTDRRRHTVTLTPAGRQLLAELGLAGGRIQDEPLHPLGSAQTDSPHPPPLKLFQAEALAYNSRGSREASLLARPHGRHAN